jgi:HAD superfamily hydrolase (TIGR01509 family)
VTDPIPRLPGFRAAVFDLDGTLVDSEPRGNEAWRQVFTMLGMPPDEALIRAFVGRRGIDVRGLLMERLPEHDPARLMAAASAQFHAPGQPPIEPLLGAVELVSAIRGQGVPLGLVTSAGRRYAELRLVQLGVRDAFSVVVAAEDVAVGKPDPQGYRAACDSLGVAAAHCVAFEDSPAGVAAVKGAGLYCVAVTTTHQAAELAAADRIVPDLSAVSWPLP